MEWKKSTKCESSACAEVYVGPDKLVAIRNTTVPAEMIWFTSDEWRAFIAGAKDGEFDL